MSFKKVVGVLGGSFLTLIPAVPFYKGIVSEDANSFSSSLADKFFSAGEKVSKELKGILQLCDYLPGGGDKRINSLQRVTKT